MIRLYSAGVRFLDQQVLPHGRRVRLLEGQLVTCPRGLGRHADADAAGHGIRKERRNSTSHTRHIWHWS